MKNLILAFTALAFLVSCGLIPQKHKTPRARHGAAPKAVITPKPEISYYRPDLGNKINGVVIFPITDLRGKNNDETKVIDPLIVSEWAQVYGADKISSAGTLVDRASKVAGKDFYVKFIASMCLKRI